MLSVSWAFFSYREYIKKVLFEKLHTKTIFYQMFQFSAIQSDCLFICCLRNILLNFIDLLKTSTFNIKNIQIKTTKF